MTSTPPESVDAIPDDVWEIARSLRGAVLWESNSAVEHIARAIMADRTRNALDTGGTAEPVAYEFELANYINEDGTYTGWDRTPRLSRTKPCVPEGSVRNLRPLYAAPPAPAASPACGGEVAVKPLEWTADGEDFFAASIVGKYVIGSDEKGDLGWQWGLVGDPREWCVSGFFPTPDEAKAAAQADYERRIRSTLASPEQGEVVREVAALLKDIRDNGLIYWEPKTWRGDDAKSKMLVRIKDALAKIGGER